MELKAEDDTREDALVPPTLAQASTTLAKALSHYFADKSVPVILVASLALPVKPLNK